jgi:hypothetical protein
MNSSPGYVLVAAALIMMAIGLLTRAAAPISTILAMMARAALACVVVGAALTLFAVMLLGQ